MGWKGALRSIEAAAKRVERERQRQLKVAHREARFQQKLLEQEIARLEVEEFEETVERLSEPHRDCGELIDWEELASASAPQAPVRSSSKELRARAAAGAYQPSVVDRILMRVERKKAELNSAIVAARQVDDRHHETVYQKYCVDYSSWKNNRDLASAILSGSLEAYDFAIESLQPFAELMEFGCKFNHVFGDAKIVHVAMTVDGSNCVPSEIKSITSTGKLSVKRMPVARFNELYQDYVCGSVLRVAREFFALLPLDWVWCTAYAEMLNSATGHREVTPVVSVKIPRSTLDALNFSQIDASDALGNFLCRMGFKRSSGFSPIEPFS